MPRIIRANNRVVEVPEDLNGQVNSDDLFRAMGVRPGRALARQTNTGENVLIPRTGRIHLNPSDTLVEMPISERGAI